MNTGGATAIESLDKGLGRFARCRLGHLPTPVEQLSNISRLLGTHILVKRDDCSGLGGGGNKVRKLEFLLGEALALQSDIVVTAGAIQSNHARITAAACARLGLSCELVLTTPQGEFDFEYSTSGNRLLDKVFGANVRVLEPGADSAPALAVRVAELRQEGRRPFTIPIGGSNAIGTLGYLDAAFELDVQRLDFGDVDAIVVPSGSGGTHAGLALGAALLKRQWRIIGVSVGRNAEEQRDQVFEVVEQCCGALGVDIPPGLSIEVFDGARGPGYGHPSLATRDAILQTARLEGLLLDPVYTGKAMAGLHMMIQGGAISRGSRVLFWHTGGAPAMFGYPTIFN